jgi:hypothetical protein
MSTHNEELKALHEDQQSRQIDEIDDYYNNPKFYRAKCSRGSVQDLIDADNRERARDMNETRGL